MASSQTPTENKASSGEEESPPGAGKGKGKSSVRNYLPLILSIVLVAIGVGLYVGKYQKMVASNTAGTTAFTPDQLNMYKYGSYALGGVGVLGLLWFLMRETGVGNILSILNRKKK
jgi:hypothetical protein